MNDCNFEKLKTVINRLDEINKIFRWKSDDKTEVRFYRNQYCDARILFENEMDPLWVDIIDALQVERERLEKEIKKYANL